MTSGSLITEKVRKLLALAQSDNVHEAANAAARAQELMARHRLDVATVAEERGEADDVIVNLPGEWQTYQPWQAILLGAVARASDCDSYNTRRNRTDVRYHVVGPAEMVSVVVELFAMLTAEIKRLCSVAAKLEGRASDRPFRRSFCIGAADEIANRLREASKETAAAVAIEATEGAQAGLVRIERQRQATEAFMDGLGLRKSRPVQVAHDSDAYKLGRKAGRDMSLEKRHKLTSGS